MATTVSETSSAVIDERRAQQLMERAMSLAERGDLPSAVLACRQAIALLPQAGQSYSMLGLLLERSGDTGGAIAAYEKVLEFAPDSFLERESLGRLRGAASQRQNARDMFAFDDKELFGEDTSDELPTAASPRAGSTPSAKIATAASAPQETAPVSESLSAASKTTSQNATSNGATTESAAAAPQAGSTPSASATRSTTSSTATAKPGAPAATSSANRSSSMPFPSTQSPRPSATNVGVPLEFKNPPSSAAKQSAWQRLKHRPTPYFRGLPLAGATAISLMFLLWANNYASSNRVGSAPESAPMTTENPFNNPAPQTPQSGPSPANPALTNQPATTSATPANAGAAAAPANPGASGPGSAPTSPGAPAATATNTAPSNPGNNTGSTPSAPAVNATGNIPTPAASASPGVVPSDTGGASSGGTPVAPSGTPSPDYTRVAPSGAAPVARPENRAANDERNARNDARAGRQDSAIDNLSRAIQSGGPDVALQYQQRAQLYLQNNDGARAQSDFQAAISAYNDMISRGDRVAIARSGIAASRRGLQMAQARR